MLSSPTSPSFHHHPYRLGRPLGAYSKPLGPLVLREPRDFDIFQHVEQSPYGLDPFYNRRSRKAMDYYYASRAFAVKPNSSALSRRSTAGSNRSGKSKDAQVTPSPARSHFGSDAISLKSKKRFRIPFPISPNPSITSNSTSVYPRSRVDSTTSSFDSSVTATTVHTQAERKVRGKTVPIPPPLTLVKSNLHPKRTKTDSVIEIIAPGPPRSDSRLSMLSPTSPTMHVQSPPPETPSFLPQPEEELRQRRLDKVMRTLGERVPPELIVTPPMPSISTSSSRNSTNSLRSAPAKMARRASLTLSSIPVSVSSSIVHARSKSREILGLNDSSSLPTPKLQKRPPNLVIPPEDNFPYNTFAKPSQNMPPRPRGDGDGDSPILFVDMSKPVPPLPVPPTPPASTPTDVMEGEDLFTPKPLTRAEKLANRASISTSVVLPGSPYHQRFAESPKDTNPMSPLSAEGSDLDTLEAWTPSRPQSIIVSPLICAQRLSFQLVVDEADASDDDLPFSSSQNPSSLHLDNPESYSKTPLHLRPDTPFLWDGEMTSPKSVSRTSLDSFDPVVRRERRQGWSGEWNRADMQDVISRLRDLK